MIKSLISQKDMRKTESASNAQQVLHEAVYLAIAKPDKGIRRHRILQSVNNRITSVPAPFILGQGLEWQTL